MCRAVAWAVLTAAACWSGCHAHAPGVSRSALGALKVLYWATQGELWKQGWDVTNETSDPCWNKWYGIACDAEGHIVSIRLANNQLFGYIPAEFARPALKWLQELDLSSNYLSGPVPASLSKLTRLRVLRLDRNWLVGMVPASLSLLSHLETLELQGNQFSLGKNGRVVPAEVEVLAEQGQCHIIA